MTLSSGQTSNVDFALPHAINLAEAGPTIQDKRIGMLIFCDYFTKAKMWFFEKVTCSASKYCRPITNCSLCLLTPYAKLVYISTNLLTYFQFRCKLLGS